jgi:hypothetical protein
MAAADHLQVPRQHGLFHHHGIDLGDGTVAHYLEGREILRSPLEGFSRGQPISVVPYGAGSCSPAGTTLRRAMGRLGEQNYNLLFNNCEHFAHWCKTGRHRSAQVEGLLQSAVLGGARLLLRQGVRIDPDLVRRSLERLERMRQTLLEQLETALTRVEARWGQQQLEAVRLAAQKLADQLSEVEELEARLERLLDTGSGP